MRTDDPDFAELLRRPRPAAIKYPATTTQGNDLQDDVVDLRQLMRLIEDQEAEHRAIAARIDGLDALYRNYARDIAMEMLRAVAAIDNGDTDAARGRLLSKVAGMETLTGPLLVQIKH